MRGTGVAKDIRLVVRRQLGLQHGLEGIGPTLDACTVDINPCPAPFEANSHGNLLFAGEEHFHAVRIAVAGFPRQGAIANSFRGKDARALHFHRTRLIGLIGPLGNVEMVRAPARHEADRVIVDVMPHRVQQAFGLIWLDGRRAEPQIVVEAFRQRLGRDDRPGAVGRYSDLDSAQVADLALLNHLDGQAEDRIVALLVADLKHAFVFADRLDHGLAFSNGSREGFFAIDVLLGPGCSQGMQPVPVFGRGNEHGVDVRSRKRSRKSL